DGRRVPRTNPAHRVPRSSRLAGLCRPAARRASGDHRARRVIRSRAGGGGGARVGPAHPGCERAFRLVPVRLGGARSRPRRGDRRDRGRDDGGRRPDRRRRSLPPCRQRIPRDAARARPPLPAPAPVRLPLDGVRLRRAAGDRRRGRLRAWAGVRERLGRGGVRGGAPRARGPPAGAADDLSTHLPHRRLAQRRDRSIHRGVHDPA
ncbi:MAG: hypothetical protein AVDCRST_MAG18-1506, partial [uncultured Thermomicrobiales bacterium]